MKLSLGPGLTNQLFAPVLVLMKKTVNSLSSQSTIQPNFQCFLFPHCYGKSVDSYPGLLVNKIFQHLKLIRAGDTTV